MKKKLRKLLRKMTSDKRKFSIMVALLLAGLLMWGRLLMKNVPRTAVAVPGADSLALDGGSDADLLLRPTVYVDFPTEMSRDPFALNGRFYPQVQKEPVAAVVEPKSTDQFTDEQRKAAQIAQALNELKLDSTILGRQPMAVINGLRVRPGQEIGGFVLLEVKPRSVVLQMHGEEVELEL